VTNEQLRDEQLLQRLGAALVPATAPATPPPAAVQDLHRVIDATRTAAGVPARRPPRALTVSVVASVAAACIAIVAVATSIPRWTRETATRVTVVTTSPTFGAVVERQRSLERALDDGNVADVTIESARVRIALATLASGEVAPIREEIEELLDRADTFLRQHQIGERDAPVVSPPDTSTTEPTTAAPDRTTPRGLPSATASTPSTVTVADDDVGADMDADTEIDDDNSGPGNAEDDVIDDNSGPGGGGGDPDPDDDSGSGSE
jgi:hypothetical protein